MAAIRYTIDPKQRLVVLRINGDVSMSTFERTMDSVIADRAFRRGMSFLSLRRSAGTVETTDYVKAALKYLDERAPARDGYKWAVVSVDPLEPHVARKVELLDEFRGHYVRIFDDFGDAMAWFSSDLYAGILDLADVSSPAAKSSRERNEHRPAHEQSYSQALSPF